MLLEPMGVGMRMVQGDHHTAYHSNDPLWTWSMATKKPSGVEPQGNLWLIYNPDYSNKYTLFYFFDLFISSIISNMVVVTF